MASFISLSILLVQLVLPGSIFCHKKLTSANKTRESIQIPAFTSSKNDRIVGGGTTEKAEFPWTARIQMKKNGTRTHHCGGTLIDPWHVLTAAHCVWEPYNVSSMEIILGDYKVYENETSQQTFKVSRYYVHEMYQHRAPLDNDVAVILLWPKANLSSKYVKSLPIFPVQNYTLVNLTSRQCIAMGWGNANPHKFPTVTPNYMKEIDLTILTNEECVRRYNDTPVYEGMLCAVGNGTGYQGVCHGDSGGPFVCGQPNPNNLEDIQVFLAGITSWVAGREPCGTGDYPSVFVKVTEYLDWIQKAVSAHAEGSANLTAQFVNFTKPNMTLELTNLTTSQIIEVTPLYTNSPSINVPTTTPFVNLTLVNVTVVFGNVTSINTITNVANLTKTNMLTELNSKLINTLKQLLDELLAQLVQHFS